MEINCIYKIFDNKPTIPQQIEKSILQYFGVDNINEYKNLTSLSKDIQKLFNGDKTTEYQNHCAEYTLYYLPMNFYKIWQPLIDLCKYNLIKDKINVLELGCGPGSSTFAIIEFYRILSKENIKRQYFLDITVVEKEKEFLKIFDYIYENYKKTFPENLNVNINKINQNLDKDLLINNYKADLIVESNVMNENEYFNQEVFENIKNIVLKYLKPHSSLIMIEPASKDVKNYLFKVRNDLKEKGFNVYSPCFCEQIKCKQFPNARVYVGNSLIVKQLKQLEQFSNIKENHYYEYMILRNDNLKKNCVSNNKIDFSNLDENIGEIVSFNAYIIACVNRNDELNLKLCDGEIVTGEEVWISIPKKILDESIDRNIDSNRGEFIEIKDALIISANKISCETYTKVKILR